ncbi:hypothetical protein ES707_09289 [subsurface metagenome]
MSDKKSAEEKDTVSKAIQNSIVYYDPTKWAAVPANNGGNGPSWQWGNELLIGFTVGKFERAKSLHQCDYNVPFDSWLARSTDGGKTWTAWKPERYAGQDRTVQDPPGNLDFTQDGFLMRIEGFGYHGNEGCQWFYSENKGMMWRGPFGFGDLMLHPELKGKEFTGRTAYVIGGPHELYLFLAVRERSEPNPLKVVLREETFLARTTDGGKTFTFISWIVPWSDPYRSVMPAPVRISQTKFVVAVRRKSELNNWIDCYESTNNGKSWSFLSKVAYTEDANKYNGNPPALIQLQDYRLCCVFGNRSTRQLRVKYSEDEGKSWSAEQILRSDFHSASGHPDLGYPRLFQRLDGKLVTAYFWCTENRPQTHIEATIF